jgi:hypothetical protein
LQKTIGNLQ